MLAMSKRKRLSSSQEDDSGSATSESGSLSAGAGGATSAVGGAVSSTPGSVGTRKRRRGGNACQDQLKQLLEALLNHKRADGTYLTESYYRLPKRRTHAEYYEAVQNPIDFSQIQVNITNHQYDDVQSLAADVELLVDNIKLFYPPDSGEHKDAIAILSVFNEYRRSIIPEDPSCSGPATSTPAAPAGSTTVSTVIKEEDKPEKIAMRFVRTTRRGSETQLQTGDDESETNSSVAAQSEVSNWAPGELEDALEELFTSLATTTDAEGRRLSTWFQLLPHRKKLPQYYEVIKQPIDLKMIAGRIQSGEYNGLQELDADVSLMCRNACTFNEPGSQIYKDARVLRKLSQTRRAEIEHARLTAAKSSERIRSKRLRGAACCSAEFAQLDYDSDEDQSSSDSNMSEDNPLWQLFDSVRSHTTPSGYVLSDPFLVLPSRRLYPDYYEEIKRPIALRGIKRKMKAGGYSNIQMMEADMNLMFENAKKYNPPESKLSKDAIKLQKVLEKKVSELSPDSDDGDDADSEGDPDPIVTPKKTLARREHPVNERCKTLFRAVRDYVHEDGRQLSTVFNELPSRKLYPDYYDIIDSPIDLGIIENKIRAEQYDTESEILHDFMLMFNNCRQYNEEGSVIYDDANILERVLMSCVRELGPLPAHHGVRNKPRLINRAQLLEKMRDLYSTILEYKDPSGRQLSTIFLKLPSKLEYPDYYEVIKSPIHLERINQKLRTGTYNNLDEIMADFVLMFDNACKYNEPDSQVYKDALSLHRLALQTKLQLTEDVDEVPDVKTLVQELLTSLFIAVYNHQDVDGRCFSDSLAELPEYDEVEGQPRVRGFSMDSMKRGLDQGLYVRLDTFQEDIFAVLDRARKLSKPDSQIFEDSVEMQMYYLDYRDELCGSGTVLSSPALRYTQDDFKAYIAQLRPDVKQEEDDSQDVSVKTEPGGSMSFNEVQYTTGEFVYVDPRENKSPQPHIVNIERLWTNSDGQQMMYGSWFFRPEETYHLPTRKFLEQEVFKSDQHIGCPLSRIRGKCSVLSVNDYFQMRPVGYEDSDVYVCESRYSSKSRSFKKIKLWRPVFAAPPNLVSRDTRLEARRVMSVFRDRVEKHKEELAELEDFEHFRRREIKDVVMEVSGSPVMDSRVYYQQLVTPEQLVLKTGDCVYVKSDNSSKQTVVQIDALWSALDGTRYIQGSSFVGSSEIASSAQQLFYKQEMFATLVQGTYPVAKVSGKCSVLDYAEYCTRRVTEVPESDVYVCESQYDAGKRQMSPRAPSSVCRPYHSDSVQQDEVYRFRKPLVVRKQSLMQILDEAKERIKSLFVEATGISSPAGSKIGDEDSLDGPPASVGSNDNSSVQSTPMLNKKGKRIKVLTGYILFSSDVRKRITSDNPEANFGDISRLVGIEWKKLPQSTRSVYEERAQRQNAEARVEMLLESPSAASKATAGVSISGPDVVYDCNWVGCDFQFEDITDLIEHCAAEQTGHVPPNLTVADEIQCQWRGCSRVRKGAMAFPNSARMIRHLREVHILRNNGRKLFNIDQRSKNFVPRRVSALPALSASSPAPQQQLVVGAAAAVGAAVSSVGAAAAAPSGQQPAVTSAEPRFVSVPARPQRLLHSEAYIRYIEGLQHADRVHSNGWERQLRGSQETVTVPDPSRLPTHWLSQDVIAESASVTKTLWHLRDYLLKDALGISRAYEGRL